MGAGAGARTVYPDHMLALAVDPALLRSYLHE